MQLTGRRSARERRARPTRAWRCSPSAPRPRQRARRCDRPRPTTRPRRLAGRHGSDVPRGARRDQRAASRYELHLVRTRAIRYAAPRSTASPGESNVGAPGPPSPPAASTGHGVPSTRSRSPVQSPPDAWCGDRLERARAALAAAPPGGRGPSADGRKGAPYAASIPTGARRGRWRSRRCAGGAGASGPAATGPRARMSNVHWPGALGHGPTAPRAGRKPAAPRPADRRVVAAHSPGLRSLDRACRAATHIFSLAGSFPHTPLCQTCLCGVIGVRSDRESARRRLSAVSHARRRPRGARSRSRARRIRAEEGEVSRRSREVFENIAADRRKSRRGLASLASATPSNAGLARRGGVGFGGRRSRSSSPGARAGAQRSGPPSCRPLRRGLSGPRRASCRIPRRSSRVLASARCCPSRVEKSREQAKSYIESSFFVPVIARHRRRSESSSASRCVRPSRLHTL